MDLATVQSGQFRGRSKISKYGNARLRRTLWIAAQAAMLISSFSARSLGLYVAQQRHAEGWGESPTSWRPRSSCRAAR